MSGLEGRDLEYLIAKVNCDGIWLEVADLVIFIEVNEKALSFILSLFKGV